MKRASARKNPTRRPVWPADSDQPVHPPSIARVLAYPSLASLEAAEVTCNQQRLWSDCANAQTDLNLHWLHKLYCKFCCALAQKKLFTVHDTSPSKITLRLSTCLLSQSGVTLKIIILSFKNCLNLGRDSITMISNTHLLDWPTFQKDGKNFSMQSIHSLKYLFT